MARFAASLIGMRPYRCMECWRWFLGSVRGGRFDHDERDSQPEPDAAYREAPGRSV